MTGQQHNRAHARPAPHCESVTGTKARRCTSERQQGPGQQISTRMELAAGTTQALRPAAHRSHRALAAAAVLLRQVAGRAANVHANLLPKALARNACVHAHAAAECQQQRVHAGDADRGGASGHRRLLVLVPVPVPAMECTAASAASIAPPPPKVALTVDDDDRRRPGALALAHA